MVKKNNLGLWPATERQNIRCEKLYDRVKSELREVFTYIIFLE